MVVHSSIFSIFYLWVLCLPTSLLSAFVNLASGITCLGNTTLRQFRLILVEVDRALSTRQSQIIFRRDLKLTLLQIILCLFVVRPLSPLLQSSAAAATLFLLTSISSSPPEAFITHLYLFSSLHYYQIGILKPSIPIRTWDSLVSFQYPINPESRWCIPCRIVVLLMWTLLEPPSVETKSQSHWVGQPPTRSAQQALESFLASQRLYRLTESSLEALARYVAHPTPTHVKQPSKHHAAMAPLTSTSYSHAPPGTS